MFWAVLSVFAFIACFALANHFYNKNHTEQVSTIVDDEHFIDDVYSVSFESLMPDAEKHYEDAVNPVWVLIDKEDKVSNPHIATCIAAERAFAIIEEVSSTDNPYVKKLIEKKNKIQTTPSFLGRDSEVCRGLNAKVKYVYDDGTLMHESEILLTKDKVDFAHKDWYSV